MGHPDEVRHDPADADEQSSGAVVHDRRWPGELRGSLRCSAALLVLLLLVDLVAGDFTLWRGALWLGLSLLLLVVLYPPRVRAGVGWLSSRGPLRGHRVRTDLLVCVRCADGLGRRLVLRDTFGDRVEIDPRVLLDNPALWHRLDTDLHTSVSRGLLTYGAPALHRVTRRIDRETALTVFRISGLK